MGDGGVVVLVTWGRWGAAEGAAGSPARSVLHWLCDPAVPGLSSSSVKWAVKSVWDGG